MYGGVIQNLEKGDETHIGVEDNIYTMSLWIPPSHEVNKRSAQKHECSNPVRPIYTTSVEMPHVVRMQKEDEEEEDSREDEDVQPFFCRKPSEGRTESEKENMR